MKWENIKPILQLLILAVSFIVLIVLAINVFILMFSHPELTRTQIWLHPDNHQGLAIVCAIALFADLCWIKD